MVDELHFFCDQGIVGHYEMVLKKTGYRLDVLRTSIQQDCFYGEGIRCTRRAGGLSLLSEIDIMLASLETCRSNDETTELFGIALSLATGYLFARFETCEQGASPSEAEFSMAIAACAIFLALYVLRRFSIGLKRNRLAQSLYVLKFEETQSVDGCLN